MSSFTCISCRVAFTDGEVQRAHYKTDWHRYNLKRKVADMPPVTSQNFQERVLAQRASSQQEAQASSSSSSSSCGVCNKRFSSANAHQNHLQSHKHQQAERRAEQEAQREVQRRNEKNLEKGLDRDARNEALKEALREEEQRKEEEQRRREGAGGAGGGGGGRRQRVEVEKPPRLVWLEEQAKRQEEKEQKEEEGAAAVEDEWEDVDDEDDMEEEEEEEEETMDQENPACTSSSCTSSCTSSSLAGSIPVTDCLFCLHHSKSLMRNIHHMTSVHSFFIPDLPFLVDLRGLVRYLGEKVGAGNVCLWCNEKGRSFYSTEAVQSHMTDKSHCRLFTDGDAALEFADFYDFRSSYPDRKEGDDESDDDLPEDKNVEYDDETLELTLPSGARIGHRSLMRYYKQRFGFQKAVTLAHNQNAVGRVLRQYKALGWAGETGSLSQRHRDMKFVQILKSRWLLKTGMNHNTTRQKHFRAQVMF